MIQQNATFDIRKIPWVRFSEMKKVNPEELILQKQNPDNVKLTDIPVFGVSDLAEVNLGVLLGFRTEKGIHIYLKSLYENRDNFARLSARLNFARKNNIPVSVGGAFRGNDSFYAVYLQIGSNFYDLTQEAPGFRFTNTRIPLAQMKQMRIENLLSKKHPETSVRFTGKVVGFSGLGSDYSYVLLACLLAPAGQKSLALDVVFTGKGMDRDKFVAINTDLDWAEENGIEVEVGGDFNGEYLSAFYFKIKSNAASQISGNLITLR